jgi:hypothetical protein
MTDQPITVIAPTIGPLLAGAVTNLRRPQGRLSTLKPGDHLWLREQFYLAQAFDHISPLQAKDRGATPVFANDRADLPDFATADLGRRRFAREMPKSWHRVHLVATHVALERLHDISDQQIIAEGYPDREIYAAGWDTGISLADFKAKRNRWANNPAVIAFGFKLILSPLPTTTESEGVVA